MKGIIKLTATIISVITLTVSCGQKGSLDFKDDQRLDDEQRDFLVNNKNMPSSPDLAEDAFIANYDYPVELSIYEDGKFYYNLDNLGDGKGTWKVVDGIIHLNAKHKLQNFNMDIDMNFYVYKGDGENQYEVSFKDRFGQKEMDVKVLNKSH